MGLDMYLFKLSRPAESEAELNRKSAEALYESGYSVFIKERDGLPPNFDSFRHLAVEVNVDCSCIDMPKIRKEYSIPEDAKRTGLACSQEKTSYTFSSSKGTTKHIEIPRDEFDKKYVYTRKYKAFCVKQKEVGYWRKNYDLQDALTEACDVQIENCGYYPLNDEMWEVIKKFDRSQYEKAAKYRDDENSVICYLEWY